ncbi:MAG: DUF4384 domain-containing protein [Blastocatellia bacterium]
MKKLISVVFLVTAVLTATGYGQEDDQARDFFRAYAATGGKGRPGAKIRIELLRDGRRQFVPLDTVFRSGDKVKLHFEVNFPAYVEIYNHGSSGDVQRLFPYQGANSRVKVTSPYVVPNRATEWFEFDDTPGTEKLAFIFSQAQIRPAAKPQKPQGTQPPKRPSDSVNPGAQSAGDETQQALNDLNSRALEEGRDLNRVQVRDEYYVFCDAPRLRRTVGVMIALKHR